MKIFAEILLRKILWGSWQFSIYLGGANIHKQIHRYIHLQTDVCKCKPKPSYIPTGLTWIPSSRSSQSLCLLPRNFRKITSYICFFATIRRMIQTGMASFPQLRIFIRTSQSIPICTCIRVSYVLF